MEPESLAHTTRLLRAGTDGEGVAAEQLLPLVYEELRHIAADIVELRFFADMNMAEIARLAARKKTKKKRG